MAKIVINFLFVLGASDVMCFTSITSILVALNFYDIISSYLIHQACQKENVSMTITFRTIYYKSKVENKVKIQKGDHKA